MAEITLARVQADLEALRIAELYVNHPLLRHMPVPHFRLPEITLNVPVIIKELEKAKKGDIPRGKVDFDEMQRVFKDLLEHHIERTKIKLSNMELGSIKNEIEQKFMGLKQPSKIPVSVIHIADELVQTVVDALRKLKRRIGEEESSHINKFIDDLKIAIQAGHNVIKEMEGEKKGKTPPREMDYDALKKSFNHLLRPRLEESKFKFSDEEVKAINKEIDRTLSNLKQQPEKYKTLNDITDKLVQSVYKALREKTSKVSAVELEQIDKFADEFKKELYFKFLELRKEPPRLLVLVTSSELREIGNKDNLANLQLTITEEAIEWTVIRSDGKEQKRLTQE